MNKKPIFSDNGTNKCKFYYPKHPFSIDDVDTGKILVSNKVSFGKDCFWLQR